MLTATALFERGPSPKLAEQFRWGCFVRASILWPLSRVVYGPPCEEIRRGAGVWATSGAAPTFTLSDDGRVLLVHNPKVGKLDRFDLP